MTAATGPHAVAESAPYEIVFDPHVLAAVVALAVAVVVLLMLISIPIGGGRK